VGSGTITGFEVDTTFFNGNHAPEVQVLGTFSPEAKSVPSTEVHPYLENG
jgi:allantoicase